jgi:hypothetical protein
VVEKLNCSVRFTKAPADLGYRNIAMTCYFRHLKEVFEKAGIEVTSENKQKIDRIIHDIVGVNYKNCPAVWRQIKLQILKDEVSFVSLLKEALNNRIAS